MFGWRRWTLEKSVIFTLQLCWKYGLDSSWLPQRMAKVKKDIAHWGNRLYIFLEKLRMRTLQIAISYWNWAKKQRNTRNIRIWFAYIRSWWITPLYRFGEHFVKYFKSCACFKYGWRRIDFYGSRTWYCCPCYWYLSF